LKPLIRAYMQMAIIVLVSLAGLSLTGCSDRFRYECQDPKNWHLAKCNPPQCKANETCTKYLIEVNHEN
jgi:hypothetical protein